METEENGSLPFLDVRVYRKPDGSLGHKVYRKPTHTDLYLNANSHHHPSQKQAVLSTLFHRAFTISDEENLGTEIAHLTTTLKQNGFTHAKIRQTIQRIEQKIFSHTKPDNIRNSSEDESVGTELVKKQEKNAYIPYFGNLSNRIARLLKNYDIRTIHLPGRKIKEMIRPVKDKLGLNTPGVYNIPCECGLSYIGQTGRTVQQRSKEHKRNIKLYYPEKSAVAQHSIETGHKILFDNIKVLHKSNKYWDRMILEAIEIKLQTANFNRDKGLQISDCWKPAIDKIK